MSPLPWLAALLAGALAVSCHHEAARTVAQDRAEMAASRAEAALSTAATIHADRAATRAAQSQAAADQAQDEVHHAPTASDPIDPGLRSAVLAGMRRMCDASDSAGTPACDPGPADQALPAR